jgi:uncharacterized repeat protein (TIGR03803 family)
MTRKLTLPVRVFGVLVLLLSSALIVMSQNPEKVLYSFTGGTDGGQPHQGAIFDQAGNLYGTTFYGGTYGAGTVYRLSPNGDGTWKQTVLYSFTGGADGGYTDWGRLAFDAAGNLYGVTVFAGQYGQGTVFKLAPNPDGTWTESVVHQFTGGEDGTQPRTVPWFDAAGNLYGTAAYGGAYGCGTIYKLTPGPGNEWTFGVIHQFMDDPACSSWVGLIPDTIGNLYGTTRNTLGGCTDPPQECGTVFKLTPSSDGTWAFKVIHQFSGGDGGSDPSVSGLIFDEPGNLYGLTEHGGKYSTGVFFKLAPGANDSWAYQVLHHFDGPRDGGQPIGQMVRDASGSLYGAAAQLGPYGYGTLFKASPNSDGSWRFSVLYNFTGSDGAYPLGLVRDSAGNLFGTTNMGGAYGNGVVYEFTPVLPCAVCQKLQHHGSE